MGHGSFMQTSFLGGLWGKLAQGRMESPNYKTALDVCENYYPVEQGALLRRQGTRYLGHTRRGNKAKLIPFDFSIIQPYQIEFTNLFARFWMGTSHLFTDPAHSILNISATTPAVVTISDAMDWVTGDDVVFEIPGTPCRATLLCNRQFTITRLTSTTFSIADALTQAPINGATVAYTFGPDDQVFRIYELASPYTTAQVYDKKLHYVQDETTVLFLRTDVKPYLLQEGGAFFTLTPAVFIDGPYFDENTTTTTFTPSGTSGSITVTASSIVGVNDGTGFQTTDVGRMMRLRSQAANWSSATTYAVGDVVTGSDGQIYTSLTSGNINHNPINDINNWAISASGIIWNWGRITARASTTQVTVALEGADPLLNTSPTTHWRMGLWSDTTGWPTCGGYHVGRLWFGGVAGNRFDASMSGKHYNFSPTASDGTVADDNAIAGTFTAQDVNQLLWFLPQEDGLYSSTPAGEWRIKASGLDDPITPTSTDARRVTSYRSADEQALSTPRGMVFTQRQKRKILEVVNQQGSIVDGNNLTDRVEQLTVTGIEEIAYQQEPTPMLWALKGNKNLIGCSYKRTSDSAYAGWHEVFLGSERLIESMSTGPDASTLAEALYLITADPDDDTKPRFVEILTPMFDSQTDDWNAWFVDTGIVPCCATLSGSVITFYGLSALEGKSVCPFIAGVDLGPRTVTGGVVTFTLGSDPDGIVTQAFLAARSALALDYGDISVDIFVSAGVAPAPDIIVPSIMAYDGPSAGVPGNVTGANGFSCAIDWDAARIYFHDDGGSAGDGIRTFLLDPGGTLVTDKQSDDIILPHQGLGTGAGGFWDLTPDGDKLIMISDSSNSSELSSVNTAALTYSASFGAISASAAPSTSTRILAPNNCCTIQAGGQDYIVSISASLAAGPEVCVLPIDAITGAIGPNTLVANLNEASGMGIPCQGPRVTDGGTAFIIGTRNWPGGAVPATTAFGIYRVTVPLGIIRAGQVAPTDVDATWTNFSLVTGLAYDQTDGNLLTAVQTTDVVANQRYIIKVNAVTAAVMWKVPVNQVVSLLDNNMRHSNIRIGWFFYIGSGGVCYLINTIAGTSTTVTHADFGSIAGQISDDVSNSVIGFGAGGGGSAIGHYMVDLGHNPVSNMFVRAYMGTVTGQDRTPLAADVVYTVGAPIGFCYTSRFKLLRPDFGNDAAAAAGPAFGKKRRVHWFGVLFHRTQKISIGVDDFSRVRPVKFESSGRTPVLPPTLHSGIVSGTVGDNYDFEGQICGIQTTAYPSIIAAVSGYLSTQDK